MPDNLGSVHDSALIIKASTLEVPGVLPLLQLRGFQAAERDAAVRQGGVMLGGVFEDEA